MATDTGRDEAVFGMTVGTGQGGVFAREILQGLRWGAVAVGTEIGLHFGQIKWGMGVRVAIVADLHILFCPMRCSVAVGTLRQRIGVLHLARGVGVINLMTEGAFLLMTVARGLQLVEDRDVALGTLLHRQGLHRLIKECRTGRNLFDLVGQIDLACSGVGCATEAK